MASARVVSVIMPWKLSDEEAQRRAGVGAKRGLIGCQGDRTDERKIGI